MTRLACWALGNMVQLEKGHSNLINDVSSRNFRGLNIDLMAASQTKRRSNAVAFAELNIVDILLRLLNMYLNDEHTLLWIVRAINNLSKSRVLWAKFHDAGITAALTSAAAKSAGSKALEWILLAQETLSESRRSTDSTSFKNTALGV